MSTASGRAQDSAIESPAQPPGPPPTTSGQPDNSPATKGDGHVGDEEQRRIWREQKRRTRHQMSARKKQKARTKDRNVQRQKQKNKAATKETQKCATDTAAKKQATKKQAAKPANDEEERRIAEEMKKQQKQREAAEEAYWRSKLLPKNDDFELCDKVEYQGKIFSYQCMFCRDLFMAYPHNHMERCYFIHVSDWSTLPGPPFSLLMAWLEEKGEYFERTSFDFTDAYKTQVLPTDDNYQLCRPVAVEDTVFYDYEEEDGHKVSAEERANGVPRREKGFGVYFYQCQFCKKLFESYPVEHLESCEDGNRRKLWTRERGYIIEENDCNFCGLHDRIWTFLADYQPNPSCHLTGCQHLASFRNKHLSNRKAPATRVSLRRIERRRQGLGMDVGEWNMRCRKDLGYWLGFDGKEPNLFANTSDQT